MDIRAFLSYKEAEKERWIAAKKQERQELSNLVQSNLPQIAQPPEYPVFLRFQSF